jgi:hypothetical protein
MVGGFRQLCTKCLGPLTYRETEPRGLVGPCVRLAATGLHAQLSRAGEICGSEDVAIDAYLAFVRHP